MKKLLYLIYGGLTYVIVSLVLTAYDHIQTHTRINVAITEGFTSRYSGIIDKASPFYYYNFVFTSGSLEGQHVSVGGKLDIVNTLVSKNVKEWVEHGGMSADEPQLPASFVHFYDPTEDEGERYLKDLLNKFYENWGVENPKTDHVEWAISDVRNEYNYEAGKTAFRNALEQPDEMVRDMNMSFAWRAFGQTLHLIADMGIASHVRDDAHPGVGASTVGYNWALDADPYEEVVYAYTSENGIDNLLTGQTDPEVEKFARKATTVKSIAEQLASYTNKNFFSHETISGADVIPKIHPDKTYDSPKLEDCTYNSSTNIYTRQIGPNNVNMCKDLSYLAILNGFRGYPYIDETCVISQATALFPQIREAGINAFRCFIPKIKVEITALGDDDIEGTVKHTIDDEYKEEIKYNGPVTIKNASNLEIIDVVSCENGTFKDKINFGNFNRTSEQLFAEIECGYVYIKSEPFVESPAPNWNYISLYIQNIDAMINLTQPSGSRVINRDLGWDKLKKYTQGTNTDKVFTYSQDETVNGVKIQSTCRIEIDPQKKLISGSYSYHKYTESDPENNFEKIHFEFTELEPDSWSLSSGTFVLRGDELCDTKLFSNLDYEKNTKFSAGWEKQKLNSYQCQSNSLLYISFQENW
jgi:hypothetical protein